MIRQLCISVCLALVSAAIPLRAANRPHAGTDSQNLVLWTNDDLENLHSLGLISIVGRIDEESPTSASQPQAYVKTQDPEWYAEQAAQLRDELERRRAQLHEYQKALERSTNGPRHTGRLGAPQ